jgi:hypothetical protein
VNAEYVTNDIYQLGPESQKLYFKTKPSIRTIEGDEAQKMGEFLKVSGHKKDLSSM